MKLLSITSTAIIGEPQPMSQMSKGLVFFSFAFKNFNVPANLAAMFKPAVGEYRQMAGSSQFVNLRSLSFGVLLTFLQTESHSSNIT
jgi:hypothetical protein